MPGRRVIVHAGFHKTGTTSAQRYLRANSKHIYPRCALVLPARIANGAARMALRYSRFGTDALLDQFAEDLRAVLSQIVPKNRSVLITDEKLAGRMPGRDGHMGYGATPALMARAEDVICDVFGHEADVVFHFTTRDPDSWLRSTYKHNLRTSRLTMDQDDYNSAYAPAADLGAVVDAVARAVTGTVQAVDMADLSAADQSPAQPLIDLIELPAHLRNRLKPHGVMNKGPDDALIDDLLALNRSGLSDEAVMAAKTDLLEKAKP